MLAQRNTFSGADLPHNVVIIIMLERGRCQDLDGRAMTGSHGTVETDAYIAILPVGWIDVLVEETEDSQGALGHGKGSITAHVGNTQLGVLFVQVPHLPRQIAKRTWERVSFSGSIRYTFARLRSKWQTSDFDKSAYPIIVEDKGKWDVIVVFHVMENFVPPWRTT